MYDVLRTVSGEGDDEQLGGFGFRVSTHRRSCVFSELALGKARGPAFSDAPSEDEMTKTPPWVGWGRKESLRRSSWTRVELQLEFSGARLEGPLATRKCDRKGREWSHLPPFHR